MQQVEILILKREFLSFVQKVLLAKMYILKSWDSLLP